MDYKQKCCALKLLLLGKQLLLNKCVLVLKDVHGKAPLKDLMIPSERLHVHGNKQLLPWTRIAIFKMSFSSSGSLAWNSLPHHLRYPMEVKTLKRKAFHALTKPPWYVLLIFLFYLPDTLTQNVLYFSPCVFLSSLTLVFYNQKKRPLIYVFSCVIVLSFAFLVVIILMRYTDIILWVYPSNFQSC